MTAVIDGETYRHFEGEISRTTLFQLEILAQAIRKGDFADAAREPGVADKHRLIKAIARLSDNMGLQLSQRINDQPVGLEGLAKEAEELLGAVHHLRQAAASLAAKPIVIRCCTYPTMVTLFLADAVHDVEVALSARSPIVKFVDLESQNRQRSWAGMVRPLLAGSADLVVGPSSGHQTLEHEGIDELPLYSWRVMAGVHKNHDLRRSVFLLPDRSPAVHVEDLLNRPLLTSPMGHASRDQLLKSEPASLGRFDFELESMDTSARVALGRSGPRVPIVASDGVMPADFDPTWPSVVVKGRNRRPTPLGGSHSIYWRRDHVSESVKRGIEQLRERSFDRANVLRGRPGGMDGMRKSNS